MKLFSRKIGNQENNLIILHGLFGASDNWYSVARLLSESYSVYILDIRNHGNSPQSQNHNYSIMVNDVKDFMAQENISKATILGHSMGGKIAMHLALEYPQLVETLIVVDVAAKNYSQAKNFIAHKNLVKALLDIDLSIIKKREDIKLQMTAPIWADYSFRFVSKNINTNTDNSFSWKLNLPVLLENIEEIANGFSDTIKYKINKKVPALFIKGEQSNYILDSDKEKIKNLFPLASFATIKGAGHWIHAQKPKELASIILEYQKIT